jgi:serine protease Do
MAQPQPPLLGAPQVEPFGVQVYSMTGGSYLGVGVLDINAERVKTLKLKEERGVEITRVDEGSPAMKAGLKIGDVVLEYNGQRIEGTEQFVRMVRETPEGRQVKLSIMREGKPETLTATVGARRGLSAGTRVDSLKVDQERLKVQIDEAKKQAQENLRGFYMWDVPRYNVGLQSGVLGVEAESLNSQLAEYFGVKEGVLVRMVNKDSAAAKAGIKAGDVITKVDETIVKQPQEITRALRSLQAKKSASVVVVRNHKEMTIQVTFDEPRSLIGRPEIRSVFTSPDDGEYKL